MSLVKIQQVRSVLVWFVYESSTLQFIFFFLQATERLKGRTVVTTKFLLSVSFSVPTSFCIYPMSVWSLCPCTYVVFVIPFLVPNWYDMTASAYLLMLLTSACSCIHMHCCHARQAIQEHQSFWLYWKICCPFFLSPWFHFCLPNWNHCFQR